MKRLHQNETSIVQLNYRGTSYTLNAPQHQQLHQNETSIGQLKYRGTSYTLNAPQHQTIPSIAFITDSKLSAVQIPRGFRYLLYRGKPYLAPCY